MAKAKSTLMEFLKPKEEAEEDPFVAACQVALEKVGQKFTANEIKAAIASADYEGDRAAFARVIFGTTGVRIPVTAAAPAPTPTPAEPEVDLEQLEREVRYEELKAKVVNDTASIEELQEYMQLKAEIGGATVPSQREPEMPRLQKGMVLAEVTAAGVIYWQSDKDAYGFAKYGGFRRDAKTSNLAHGRHGDAYVRFYASGQKTNLTTDQIAERVVLDARGQTKVGGKVVEDPYARFESVRSWSKDDSRKADHGEEGGTFTIYQFVGDDFAGETVANELAYDLKGRRLVVTGNTRPFEFQAPPESVEDLEIPF